MQKVKLIASDLDGTLLLNGAQKLNDGTCALIEKLIDKRGITFIAASGRQYYGLRRLFAPIADKISYICENGCISYCNGEIIHQALLDQNLADEIIAAIQATDGCEVMASGKNSCYVQPKHEKFFYHVRDVLGQKTAQIENLFEHPEPYMKVSIFAEDGVPEVAHWKKLYGDLCTVQTGGREWLDFMPLSVNKGTALEKVLAHLKISAAECVAFGDNDNDTEMLKLVGYPITMNTAVKSVFPLGKLHTDTVESILNKILDEEGFYL